MHPHIHAATQPGKAAYIMASDGKIVSYAELEERSNRLARFFLKNGLNTGDHVAMLMENHHRYFDVIWAAQRIGLHLTPVSTELSGDEVAYIINDSNAQALITSHKMAQIADALLASTPGVRLRLMVDSTTPGYLSYEEEVSAMSSGAIENTTAGQLMLYSSGTTGRPKGIKRALTGQNLDVSVLGFEVIKAIGQMSPNTVYLSPAPLYHASPLSFCMAVMSAGGTAVIMSKFDAEQALSVIERYRVTLSQWVPTMLIRLLKLPEEIRKKHDLSSMIMAIHAAAPCPVEVKKQILQWWGPVLYEFYSGSEGIGMTFVSPQEWLAHEGTVGKSIGGKIYIIDEDGKELPAGKTGLVYFGDSETFNYHNDPGKTASIKSSKGWATLGDVGYLDEEGYLYLTDRKDFMIISGGVNVYPQEVENLLAMHPKVADVAVFGVPNAEFGEEVKAVVQPSLWSDAGPELEAAIIAYCRAKLSHVKCPRSVEFVEKMPRTSAGKLFKKVFRDKYWNRAG